jgi:hypothetical protein
VTRHDRIFTFGSIAISGALYAALRPVFAGSFGPPAAGSLVYGLAVALAVVAASFVLMRRAILSSNRFFQIAFVGGVLGRLALFGIAIGVAFAVSGLDGIGAAVAIAAGFVPLTVLEVFCVVQGRAALRP